MKFTKKNITTFLVAVMTIFFVMFSTTKAWAVEPENEKSIGINFIIISETYLSTPGVQKIVISAGEDTVEFEMAKLKYENTVTNAIYEIESTQIEGNAALFDYTHDNSQSGIYRLSEFSAQVDGKIFNCSLTEDDQEYVYGVNESIVTEPDAFLIEPDDDYINSEIEDSVVSFEVEGDSLHENIITDYINEALSKSISENPKSRLNEKRKDNPLIVCLDPGHDSRHAGAQGNGLSEEKLTLKIAKYCKEELEKYSNVKVYLTRETESCPVNSTNSACLSYRPNYAASVNADVFVSIHLNSSTNKGANGAEVYVPNNSSYNQEAGIEGQEVGQKILDKLVALGLTDRGIQIRNSENGSKYPDGSIADYYAVINGARKHGIPGIIVEHAFLSNVSDATNYLKNETNLQKLGVADATGIAEYYGLSMDEMISEFVERLYIKCLNRESDPVGLKDWTRKLSTKEMNGIEVASLFVFSQEYANKNASDSDFIKMLYETLLGRSAGSTEVNNWLSDIECGVTRKYVYQQIANSIEFSNICNSYNIQRGTYTSDDIMDKNINVTKFVHRTYKLCLGREQDPVGGRDWVGKLINKKKDGVSLVWSFTHSPEFANKKLSNYDYVEILYNVFLDRDSDPIGQADWNKKLNSGISRDKIMVGFANSVEFGKVCDSYGILQGYMKA